ncbi:hypothetical protein [Rhizobium sp. RHZ01]|uniref:hypothetical protein n=1 Tax=Rhizobium sp. RHZ01 TaxID=2769304 RepID=UPI0004B2C586|nr:hypothetical protein [Rhizobium sp. RHZ01]MBD9448146.1 hypothetical protein [Rhizobium sp. RHZ01]
MNRSAPESEADVGAGAQRADAFRDRRKAAPGGHLLDLRRQIGAAWCDAQSILHGFEQSVDVPLWR